MEHRAWWVVVAELPPTCDMAVAIKHNNNHETNSAMLVMLVLMADEGDDGDVGEGAGDVGARWWLWR